MQLILLQKVTNLGNLGDKVKVKPGYGRNFLVPQGKAVPATAANVAMFEAKRAEYEARAKAQNDEAESRRSALEGASVTLKANASTEGKLYGSVGPRDIAEALTAAGYKVGKSEVVLDLLDTAKKIVADAKARGADIPLPVDVVTAKQFLPDAAAEVKAVDAVAEDDLILDIGPQTAAQYAQLIGSAALAQGIPVIEVNPDVTPLSGSATASIRDTAARALPGLLDRLHDFV